MIVSETVHITRSVDTLTTKFVGAIPANGSNSNLVQGAESITTGTGIYAVARGKGTFAATIDFNTGDIVALVELNVQMPH